LLSVDSAKAFDHVDHSVVIRKLVSLGVSSVLHVLWLKLLNVLISHPSSDLCIKSTLNSCVVSYLQFLFCQSYSIRVIETLRFISRV